MNRTDLQQLADVRLAEAEALLALPTPLPDGAYYLAGYAVECALKACIAKMVSEHEWPDKAFVNRIHTHDLEALLRLAKLESAHELDTAADPVFDDHWSVVADWDEQSRYSRHALDDATAMVNAVSDSNHGVLRWMKAHW